MPTVWCMLRARSCARPQFMVYMILENRLPNMPRLNWNGSGSFSCLHQAWGGGRGGGRGGGVGGLMDSCIGEGARRCLGVGGQRGHALVKVLEGTPRC